MSDPAEHPAEKQKETPGSFLSFLLKLAVAVFILRSFVFSPFSIPSESMLPRLMNGDYLVASKWSYGISNYSLPFSMPLIPGRWFASQPERGDVAIFKHPVDESDYIKRVIGLPGDTVEMRDGKLFLNGEPVQKERIADVLIPVSPNTDCAWGAAREAGEDGREWCRYIRFRETLPNGVSYEVLDFGPTPQDDFDPRIVPDDTLFMMGDNRDNSLDSRFPAEARRGLGFVPQGNLVGKARFIAFSTDGSAEWLLPWTWFTAARSDRIGNRL